MIRGFTFIIFLFLIKLTGMAQMNDDCSGAIPLMINDTCSFSEFSNVNATSEADSLIQDPSCGVFRGGDVWFTVVMPASGALRIETENLERATPHSIVLYSGTCGSLTEVHCIQLDKQKTILQPSLAGQTLYIRMFNFGTSGGTRFKLCVWEPDIPLNDNCAAAIWVPPGDKCSLKLFTNAFATSEPAGVSPDPSCGAFKGGDVWIKTTVSASGALRLEMNNLRRPTPLSFSIYSGECGSMTEIFCSQLDETISFYDPVIAGELVLIRIYSFDTEEGGEFELCLYTPEEPPNDNCEEALEIEVTESCNKLTFTNELATSQPVTVAPDPSCGIYRGGDVWFKAAMPASGNLRVETNNLAGVNAHSITLYSGACGLMTEKFCIQLEEKETFHAPELAGQSIYFRLFTYSNEEGGPFELCIYEPACRDTVVDAGTLTLCQGESFTLGSQVADKPGMYSEKFKTAEGCDSLVILTISVNPVYNAEESYILCPGESYTFPDGLVHEKVITGETHISHLLTSQGCDSLVETTLMVREMDFSVSQAGFTLMANEDSAAYQWIDCSAGSMPLPGEIGQTFTGEAGKGYAVEVTKEGCTFISDCYSIEVVGIEKGKESGIRIYPNPATDLLRIERGNQMRETTLEIRSLNGGSAVLERLFDGPVTEVDISFLPTGVYLLQLKDEDMSIRIIKK
jgi:hypothetical protein